MTLKYDFALRQDINAILALLVYLNDATKGLLVYIMVLSLSLVALYVMNRYMDDMSLSLAYVTFFSIIMAILFYYLGIIINSTLFSGAILIALILLEVIQVALLYYARNKLGGD